MQCFAASQSSFLLAGVQHLGRCLFGFGPRGASVQQWLRVSSSTASGWRLVRLAAVRLASEGVAWSCRFSTVVGGGRRAVRRRRSSRVAISGSSGTCSFFSEQVVSGSQRYRPRQLLVGGLCVAQRYNRRHCSTGLGRRQAHGRQAGIGSVAVVGIGTRMQVLAVSAWAEVQLRERRSRRQCDHRPAGRDSR